MKGFLFFCCCLLAGLSLPAQTVLTKNVSVSDVVEYIVLPIKPLNTPKTEFAAVPYEKGIVFVSEQKTDLVNFENFDPSGLPFLDLFYSEKKEGSFSKKHSFSQKYNTEYHDGPISFNKDYTHAYLTRAVGINKRDKSFVNRSKLYVLDKKGNSWSKPTLFAYDSDAYSIGHASVSGDGKFLFFASDMPGGQGGLDIYVCEWTGTDWSAPKNLGPQVNSVSNELYPFIRQDGVLFFSSNKTGGFGGLDIYSAVKDAKTKSWATERNEGININSSGDDFSICFSDSAHGFLSSNREGNDDLYSFSFEKKLIDFEGFVLNTKDIFDPSPNMQVELIDSSGNKISQARTDENGYFKFHSLNSNETYLVRIDETDSAFSNQRHYYLADKNYNIMRVTGKKGEDRFVFKNLPKDKNAVPELYTEDDVNIAGNLLSSQNPATPVSNAKLVLKDKNGNIIDEAVTNEFGSFAFSRIPPDETYVVEVVETDGSLPPGTKITLTNKNGKVMKTVIVDQTGKFKVQFLPADKEELKDMEVEDMELVLDFNPAFYDENDKPISSLVVFLRDEQLRLLGKDTTDDNGRISFRKLLTDKNYVIEFDESDPRLSGFKKIVVKTHRGKIVKEIIRNNGHFNYHILKGSKDELSDIYVDDPWLAVFNFKNSTEKKEIVIEEQVRYAYGDFRLGEEGKQIMEKVLKIMKENPGISIELGSHTDAQSSSDFNKNLSEKRAKTAIAYLIERGIAKKRLKATGYGETRLKNKCADGISCTEEEHAENRRTEFHVISDLSTKK
jgi:outer membrane protein OmpA-like peptidoglycan-associated protein